MAARGQQPGRGASETPYPPHTLTHKFKQSHHTLGLISYEWEMKNLSSNQNSQHQPNTPSTNQLSLQQQQEEEKTDDDKPRCDWDFNLSAIISSSSPSSSDAIGVVEFDQAEHYLATGGIARKIRIYSVQSLLLDYYLCTPAKLSSLKWKPGSGSRVIGSGDYDGVVTEYDLEKRVPVFERDEHGGRRVWSMDYSHWDPILGASGSDDGTMQMWDPRCDNGGKCLAAVQPNRLVSSPVCCVEFNPFGGPLVSVGCADGRVYGYDIRSMDDPVFVLDGHEKAVTYTRFMDLKTIVSSSVDGSLMTWSTENQRIIRAYKGHVNSKRFVGLSVWRNGGLLSCGSEDSRVFVYDMRWGDPIWVHGLETGRCGGFVSGVCWRQTEEERCTLVAGGSNGVLQVFQGQRKSQYQD